MSNKLLYLILKVKGYLCDISAVILYTLLAYKVFDNMGISDVGTFILAVVSAIFALGAIVLCNIVQNKYIK